MLDTLLIANRGEIACRIATTAKRLGIRTVAIYSDADAQSRHVDSCDVAVHVGGSEASQSYLQIEKIIAAAKKTGAQAIHPGYGFLAENEAFANACKDAGILFVGPPAQAISAMGDKSAAKSLMKAAGVPLVPGYHGDNQETEFLKQQADEIGYPVLIKAAAGGGGMGMRIVENAAQFEEALLSCKREAAASFGNDRVLIERYLLKPRHIEIQIMADNDGNVVHLFERDCSVQRRYQKVIEEAPAPGISPEMRQEMGAAAIAAARAVNYVGAGTVEFIVEPDGRFYFMEMNTRLQVEHPVTEMITGLDLVEWQLKIAVGQPLPYSQDELSFTGHAIEARIYAENPDNHFLPSTGQLHTVYWPPHTEFSLCPKETHSYVRVDSGIRAGDEISPFYDPMVAKLIVHAPSRREAITSMRQALAETYLLGVHTNISFLYRLFSNQDFIDAHLSTGLIEACHDELFAPQPTPDHLLPTAVISRLICLGIASSESPSDEPPQDPWSATDSWRINNVLQRTISLIKNDEIHTVQLTRKGADWTLTPAAGDRLGTSHTLRWESTLLAESQDSKLLQLHVDIDQIRHKIVVALHDQLIHIFAAGNVYTYSVDLPNLYGEQEDTGQDGGLKAPMPGKVIALEVQVGDEVEAGQKILTLEAMKMEHSIDAPIAGTVTELLYAVGDQVQEGVELAIIEAKGDA